MLISRPAALHRPRGADGAAAPGFNPHDQGVAATVVFADLQSASP